MNSHKDAFALKLIGGYKFSENFALEGGYYYLGKHDCDLYGTTTTGTGKKQYTGAVNSSMVGHLIGIDAVGICPLFDSGHSLFAKVGVGVSWSQLKEDVHYQVNGTNPISTKRSHNVVNVVPKFGVGYEWGFTERLSMRIEYEYLCRAGYYKDFKNNYHFVTLGMKFGF